MGGHDTEEADDLLLRPPATTAASDTMAICHMLMDDEPFAYAPARDAISPRQPLPDDTHTEQAL